MWVGEANPQNKGQDNNKDDGNKERTGEHSQSEYFRFRLTGSVLQGGIAVYWLIWLKKQFALSDNLTEQLSYYEWELSYPACITFLIGHYSKSCHNQTNIDKSDVYQITFSA